MTLSDRRQGTAWWLMLICAVAIALTACATDLPRPDEPPIVPASAWGSTTAPSSLAPHRIARITVHHQGEVWKAGTDVPAYLRRLQTWSREARRWADIPYHYVVAPDGMVYEARPPAVPGETNTEYDPRGHLLVMLLGNFEEQQVTPAQWNATVALLARLMREQRLDTSVLGMHRDFSRQTVCPGANLVKRFDELRAAVDARMRALR